MFFLDSILVPPIRFRPPAKGGDSVSILNTFPKFLKFVFMLFVVWLRIMYCKKLCSSNLLYHEQILEKDISHQVFISRLLESLSSIFIPYLSSSNEINLAKSLNIFLSCPLLLVDTVDVSCSFMFLFMEVCQLYFSLLNSFISFHIFTSTLLSPCLQFFLNYPSSHIFISLFHTLIPLLAF